MFSLKKLWTLYKDFDPLPEIKFGVPGREGGGTLGYGAKRSRNHHFVCIKSLQQPPIGSKIFVL